jgi:death-on-curing protein
MELLSLEEILILHQRALKEHGGSQGIRDQGLLESALNQPHQTFGGADLYSALEEKVAVLGHSIIKNHPFIDGNKRTGFLAMDAVLRQHGYYIEVEPDEGEFFILCVADGEASRDELVQWIRDHVEPMP